ncbi:EAL domain-containing protein [Brenneria goodwinii]|nr:EAL domain-containing protein [Brenneria goodwinii]MCG8160547.1 EAL domain-containing protein [Brenneria goodwinii]MCG8166351.1 EAL domain-containing protein [Brenneria goodwinii]MCG8171087.1 EAL domain-containing protein [Brenneria goodwinii]MCG8176157.1 EAL domain-containing protein [Brenneria goodwinii]
MNPPAFHAVPSPCGRCKNSGNLGFDFTMAFQPIVDCATRRIFGYEALVRGTNNV